MPRRSRIDVPGALHHIIGRAIKRSRIFWDDTDRNEFLERLAGIIEQTDTRCYAWALMPNLFYLLLKTGRIPIATVMRRLLTGYVGFYNRRHRRYGHLFQNRYKSILCQEDAYLSDERILGVGDFVDKVLGSAQEQLERTYAFRARGIDLKTIR